MMRDILLVNRELRDVNPLVLGEHFCEPGHQYGPAMRDYYLIHFVVSGSGIFERDGQRLTLGRGDLFLIPPHLPAFYRADFETPWHYVWVGFSSSIDLSPIFDQRVLHLPACGPLFFSMLQSESLTDTREYAVCGKIYELLDHLFRGVNLPADPAGRYVLMAQNYIESHYYREITVSMIANHLSLDRSYFSTLFKRRTGRSPQQYLVDYRLNKAAECMVTFGYTPSQAAASCGYSDLFNFSRMFKKKFGLSPRAYRALHTAAPDPDRSLPEQDVPPSV